MEISRQFAVYVIVDFLDVCIRVSHLLFRYFYLVHNKLQGVLQFHSVVFRLDICQVSSI